MTEGKWVTLKGGRRVFIKEGQTLTDAINEYDSKLTKKINTAEKRYIKAKHDNDNDKELWNAAQVNELNNKNPDLDRSYHMTERNAAKNYINSANRVANAESKVKSLKKEQESFRTAAMEAQDQVIEYDKKHFIKKSDEKKNFIKSNEKFNSNNAATYTGTDGTVAKVYVNKYMGKNKAGETLYSVYTSSGKEQIVLGKNIKVVEHNTKRFITDTRSNAQKRYDEGGPRYF